MICETCLYSKNCQFFAKHKSSDSYKTITGCTAYKDSTNMVEVVRCEDCTFYEKFEKVEDFDGRCALLSQEFDKEFYCQYGSRK